MGHQKKAYYFSFDIFIRILVFYNIAGCINMTFQFETDSRKMQSMRAQRPSDFNIVFLGSIQIYEALLWAVNRINQDSGTINGEPITDSYVPGIKIGESIFNLVVHGKRSNITQKRIQLFHSLFST